MKACLFTMICLMALGVCIVRWAVINQPVELTMGYGMTVGFGVLMFLLGAVVPVVYKIES